MVKAWFRCDKCEKVNPKYRTIQYKGIDLCRECDAEMRAHLPEILEQIVNNRKETEI